MDDYKRKRELKKIEDRATRSLSFSRRSKGLVKKVYELYVLCDIDVALIMFSPSGRLTQFSGNKRIEEVLTRYMNLPEKKQKCPSETEKWVRAFNQLMASEDMETQQPKEKNVNSQTKELQEEIVRLKQKLQILEEQLSSAVSESHERLDSMSMEELESMEKSLLKTLEHVSQRKLQEYLSGDRQSAIDPPSSQEMLTSLENQVVYGSPPTYICQGSDEATRSAFYLDENLSLILGFPFAGILCTCQTIRFCKEAVHRWEINAWTISSQKPFNCGYHLPCSPLFQHEVGRKGKAEKLIPPDEDSGSEEDLKLPKTDP